MFPVCGQGRVLGSACGQLGDQAITLSTGRSQLGSNAVTLRAGCSHLSGEAVALAGDLHELAIQLLGPGLLLGPGPRERVGEGA